MKIKILGCSGGIGGRHLRTTSMLVDHDILIDAGTGAGDLNIGELALIDHVFVTHSHLDHIASIPFIVDTVGTMRARPLVVHALQETIDVLRTHIFNWKVWPDFAEIPSAEEPFMTYEPLAIGDVVTIKGRQFRALPANHVVPAVGYEMTSISGNSLVFTGDTTQNDPFWPIVNSLPRFRYLIIETAFCNRERQLAIVSKHLCPSLLAEELAKLQRDPEIYVTHLKPGEIELTMQEIEQDAGEYNPRLLQNGQIFEF